jgi:phage-related protein
LSTMLFCRNRADKQHRIRQYRSRLTQWKLDKNIKPEEMKAIVRYRQQRNLIDTGKGSLKFRVRGREVEPQKIERWMRKHELRESMIYAPSPTGCQLLGRVCQLRGVNEEQQPLRLSATRQFPRLSHQA